MTRCYYSQNSFYIHLFVETNTEITITNSVFIHNVIQNEQNGGHFMTVESSNIFLINSTFGNTSTNAHTYTTLNFDVHTHMWIYNCTFKTYDCRQFSMNHVTEINIQSSSFYAELPCKICYISIFNAAEVTIANSVFHVPDSLVIDIEVIEISPPMLMQTTKLLTFNLTFSDNRNFVRNPMTLFVKERI